MTPETKEQIIERRHEEILRGATEAIRREVAWLRRHRFAVWVCDENGDIVDVSDQEPEEPEKKD